jgi:hypothetical protein
VLAAVSAALLCLLGLGMTRLQPRDHFLTLPSHCYVALDPAGLSFYSDKSYGPYRGSVIGFAESPDFPTCTWSNFPFYYRHFRWPNGNTMWTLTVYSPWLLLPLAIAPLIWLGQFYWRLIRINFQRRLLTEDVQR